MRYAVVVEKATRNYSAFLPDVPGCIATGKTVQETLVLLQEALVIHFDSMCADNEAIPDPETLVTYIDVQTPAEHVAADAASKPSAAVSALHAARRGNKASQRGIKV